METACPVAAQSIMKTLTTTVSTLLLTVSLAAQSPVCTTVVDGIGCGPQLDVNFVPVGTAGNNHITVDVGGLDPTGIGIMGWGTIPLNLPLTTGCNAYTDFLWGHIVNPDGAGDWSWFRSWPSWALTSYRIQVAGLALDSEGDLVLTLTDCVVASCQ